MPEIYCKDCEHFDKCVRGYMPDCPVYYPKKGIMTNEEWLKSCNTEQLAEWIADKINDTVYSMSIDAWAGDVDRDEYWQRKSEWAEWLKQPYSPK